MVQLPLGFGLMIPKPSKNFMKHVIIELLDHRPHMPCVALRFKPKELRKYRVAAMARFR